MIADSRTVTLLARFHDATARLEALIEATPTPVDSSREAVQARAAYRMGRLRRFLDVLGNPHQGYPIVHVGGTSGKGSTTTTIAAILTAAGYRTGLHTSPYLQTPAEKLQVGGRLVDPEQYVNLIDRILAAHDEWIAGGEDALTYGEAWFALTALFYRENAVDVAVLEVGAGGRFDLTNIVDPVLSVITSVGIDHTHTLGNTIESIAWHKAGIVKPGVPAVTAVTNPAALALIVAEAESCGSPLTIIDPDVAATEITMDPHGTGWVDASTGQRFHTGLRGSFQARNGATAIAAVRALRNAGLAIPDEAIAQGLQAARIPGRAEMVSDTCPVLLDGAHNADKVAAIAADLPALLPIVPGGRRVAVLGVLEAKQALGMMATLVPVTDALVATSPQVTAKESREASAIASLAREAGFHGEVWVEPQPRDAIARAVSIASESSNPGAVFVTGSLYLVGNVRERWYRADEIVLARSPWPGVAGR